MMKGIHLVAFLAFWTVITASELPEIFAVQEECPTKDTCPPKLLPHESDCAKYYECKGGQKQLRSCAAGLYFSAYWRGCVNWDISDCEKPTTTTTTTTTPTTTPDPGPNPSSDCTGKPDGTLVKHECQCDKFYECKNGQKALRECPNGEVFVPGESRCKPGDKNDPNCKPDPAPDCYGRERKPHHCHCEEYYECDNGQWIWHTCGEGSHFSNETNGCVPGKCNPECVDGDTKNHDCCCDKYFVCINEDWIERNCEDGQHYSNSTKTCMNPRDAHCTDYTPCGCKRTCNKIWRHQCDCSLYYECVNDVREIRNCNCGYYFNKATLTCDVATNVRDCKNSWD